MSKREKRAPTADEQLHMCMLTLPQMRKIKSGAMAEAVAYDQKIAHSDKHGGLTDAQHNELLATRVLLSKIMAAMSYYIAKAEKADD